MRDDFEADGPIGVLRQVVLAEATQGRLWLTGLPNTSTRLADFLAAARAFGVVRVLVLTEHDEMAALAPSYAAATESSSFPFIIDRFPIRDFGVPRNSADFLNCAGQIAAALRDGERIVVHCRGGVGRSGMMAQAVLVALGMSSRTAGCRVADAGSHCETAEQIDFLREAFAHAQD